MPSDRELLLQYARQGDEAEFAELVRRHADFVYSVALRVTCNSALAQDVTQVVFTQLARQATQLDNYNSLVGWLHTAARRRAIDAVRTEERRRAREHEATAMQQNSATPETNWTEIRPLLDEAVGQLRETDRDVVLLRFFKNLSHQEVGAALGLGEEAARKRVDRALDKLREHFARRGVKASSTLLATAMAENSVQAAPIGLVANVTGTSLSAATSASVTTNGLLLKMLSMNTQTKLLVAAVIAITLALITFSWLRAHPSSVSQLVRSANLPEKIKLAGAPQVEAPVLAAANPLNSSKSPTADSPNNYDPRNRAKSVMLQLQSVIGEIVDSDIDQLQRPDLAALHLSVDEQNLLQADVIQLQSFLDQAPTLNAEGNEATYLADSQTWAKVKALLADSKDPLLLNLAAQKVVFNKDDDGHWFFDNDDLYWGGNGDGSNPKFPTFKPGIDADLNDVKNGVGP